MPYCDECGNEVSVTDKRCSKCGNELNLIPPRPPIKPVEEDIFTTIKNFFSPEPYHNIEFILALIGVVFTVIAVSQSINDYSFMYSNFLLFVLISLFVSVMGAILIRYHAKSGAIIILFASFSLMLFGVQHMLMALIFCMIAAVLAFLR